MSLMAGHRIAIDFGEKRFGVAISDASGMLANPVGTFDKQELFLKMKEIAEDMEISTIYVGLPLHLSGAEGSSAILAREFARSVEDLGIAPVRLVDERLSTKSAAEERALVSKYGIDSVAAAEILRIALEGERIQGRIFGRKIDD